MAKTFFFYDLETSGINPREQRIMQFAGQRTDMNLSPVEEPHNHLLALTDDVLPDPWAIMVTGITPQQTKQDGMSEAEFLRIFHEQIAIPGTVFVGFNTVRFDDEFMRYLHYRNFYDAYEWHWKDDRSRWDLLDVTRLCRALRPEGIEWPFASDGRPSNRLELLTKVNNLTHKSAHDALSDVIATIEVARLVKQKQPKLFDYLLSMRDKKKVQALVESGDPFVYASGKYPAERHKTVVALRLGDNPKSGALVYDLYHDPRQWIDKTPEELAEAWRWKKDSEEPRLPVKTLQYNRCPAVAPLSVLDSESKKRLQVTDEQIKKHTQIIQESKQLYESLRKALEILNKQRQEDMFTHSQLVDGQLYDGFFKEDDKRLMQKIQASSVDELRSLKTHFHDKRLEGLLILYKARNYPNILTESEEQLWQDYRARKLFKGQERSALARYMNTLQQLATDPRVSSDKHYILEELQLYAESIAPLQ